jgi:hypothetical protein
MPPEAAARGMSRDIGIFVLVGFGLWWAKEQQDNYSRTEKRVLHTALMLTLALMVIGRHL